MSATFIACPANVFQATTSPTDYKVLQLVKAGLVTVVSRFDHNGRQTSNFYQITAPPRELSVRFAIDIDVLKQSLSSVDLKVYSCLSRHADENGKTVQTNSMIDLRQRAERAKTLLQKL